MKKKIGIVGCGMIGTAIADAVKTKFTDNAVLTAVCDIDLKKAGKLGEVMPVDKLIDAVDIIVEAVSPSMVKELAPKVIEKGKEILVMSTGGLLGMKIEKGIHIPSGAIAGIDGILSAREGKIEKITLTTTKPPESLGMNKITEDKVLFEGTVEEAVKKYPKNINVSATIAVVSGRPDLITVRIVASPKVSRNTHEIDLTGDFGRITCRMENEPSKDNPKTSYLAVLSAIATLRKILEG